MKLSGWKRLWIFIGVLYFFIVAIGSYSLWPISVERDLQDTVTKIVKNFGYGPNPTPIDYSTFDCNKLPYALGEEPLSKKRDVFDKIAYERLCEKLVLLQETNPDSARALKHLFMTLGIWVGPLVLLYILGCGVGWVYRGFRKG